MSQRVFNFSAGPSVLPLPVLEQVAREMTCYRDTGVSILELGHRTEVFKQITAEAIGRVRKILRVPEDYEVFFLQGGGRLMFSILPMNFCDPSQRSQKAAYVNTGTWSCGAYQEAVTAERGVCLWDGKATNYSSVPSPEVLQDGAFEDLSQYAYLHYTSNETIEGVQFDRDLKPQLGSDVPIVCDMSSEFLSRKIDIKNFDLVYACIQKNLGPAGATIVIAKRSLLERCDAKLPGYCNLKNHATAESMWNTPPTFCIYVANLVLQWFENTFGDLETVGQFSREKCRMVYDAIERSPLKYQLHARPECRSQMNVTFRLLDSAGEKRFLTAAENAGLAYLPGHRSVGGFRASLYNAMPMEGARALGDFLQNWK